MKNQLKKQIAKEIKILRQEEKDLKSGKVKHTEEQLEELEYLSYQIKYQEYNHEAGL